MHERERARKLRGAHKRRPHGQRKQRTMCTVRLREGVRMRHDEIPGTGRAFASLENTEKKRDYRHHCSHGFWALSRGGGGKVPAGFVLYGAMQDTHII